MRSQSIDNTRTT